MTSKDCKHIETLLGPISLDILDHPSGRRIVLLGDRHRVETKCPNDFQCEMGVFHYLAKLFDEYKGYDKGETKQSPKYLDFFLEMRYRANDNDAPMMTPQDILQYQNQLTQHKDLVFKSYLTTIKIMFWNCFQKLKTKCQYYNKPIRFHYADVRTGVLHSGTEKEERIFLKEIHLFDTGIKNLNSSHIQPYLRLLSKLQKRDIGFFFRYGKIQKQLDKIKNSQVQTLLERYLLDHIQDVQKEINEWEIRGAQLLVLVKINPQMVSVKQIKEFQMYIIGRILAPLFEIYTLARIFRHDMYNIIIYAGAAHTRSLKKFFVDHFGFKVTVSKQSDNNGNGNGTSQCISLKGVPQPWFV